MKTADRYFPIELDVLDRRCAVIGADAVVLSKVRRLLAAGAKVDLHPLGGELHPELADLAEAGALQLVTARPEPASLRPYLVIFVSPALEEPLGRELFDWARAERRLFCLIDRPERCTFINPAAATVSGIGLRLASGGVSPGLIKRLRQDLQAALGDERMARFVAALAKLREATPRRERARRMTAAVRGFSLRAELHFPNWFVDEREPPSG